MIALLVSLAAGAEVQAVSTTVVQARPDMLGDVFVPLRQSLWGQGQFGGVAIEGYGDLAWSAGVDREVLPEMYVLAADGGGATVDWTVGRHRIDLPTFGRMLDGGRIGWSPNDVVRVEAWAGHARHVGLDGFASGAPLVRAAASYRRQRFSSTLGAWAELGDAANVHTDLRARWQDVRSRVRPDVAVLGSVALGGDEPAFERLRFDAGLRPVSGVDVRVWGEHREVAAPVSALGQSILAAFAPDGVDELGAGVGFTDTRRDQLWVEGGVQSWIAAADEDPSTGFTGQVSWRPTCGASTWCLSPGWRAASGPGGVYHAVSANLAVPTPHPVALAVHGVVVPFRKPFLAWDTAVAVGATVGLEPAEAVWSLRLGGEVARDTTATVSPRGWLAFRMETP